VLIDVDLTVLVASPPAVSTRLIEGNRGEFLKRCSEDEK
jgi:hypothetical protein